MFLFLFSLIRHFSFSYSNKSVQLTASEMMISRAIFADRKYLYSTDTEIMVRYSTHIFILFTTTWVEVSTQVQKANGPKMVKRIILLCRFPGGQCVFVCVCKCEWLTEMEHRIRIGKKKKFVSAIKWNVFIMLVWGRSYRFAVLLPAKRHC